jgi:hypothetical protein
MSSPGSAALTIDLPPRLVADRVAVALIVACAVTIEMAAARHPAAPAGLGVVASTLLSLSYAWRSRRLPAVTAATLDGAGQWRLVLADGTSTVAELAPGSRILGSSVVLRWTTGGRHLRSAWLTSRDVPQERLRQLTVRLLASGTRTGA